MKFGCLLAVKDIHASRAFYETLFGLIIEDDFGRNITFDCGLSLQQDFDWLTGIPKSEMKQQENNCELFFEREDFDGFVSRLHQRNDVKLLHDVREYPWGQRVIRFYDLDDHLIEVGECMGSVVLKWQDAGMTLAEIAQRMDVTVQDVHRMLGSKTVSDA